ncbi:SGNH/GDSL hydrolase family protein [Arvimicrobium flavum]|uniref:SGNH/GDSL hydrolase family protein n=1 Tax=Arvimicrobium flavum TaxID=3393320 RepID=UPI00237A3812|nr:SGNH/GDSL hydrolase family protein [Mesorhizobium shangrilense]
MARDKFNPAALLTWLASSIYVWQGVGVRLRTERLAPAKGPVLHRIDGAEPPIGLLVLGDSSAASVGVGNSEQGLASQLAAMMAERTGRAVNWRAAGFNSATAGGIRDQVVPNLPHEPWTHIVLSIGTNDTKNFHSVSRWGREFGTLLYALRAKWPEARLIWSPVVDMTRVPALPKALGRILEVRAQAINGMGVRLCRERSALGAPRLPILDPAAGFSTDGFHASEAGYLAWAEHLVELLLAED